MKTSELRTALQTGAMDARLSYLYGIEALKLQKERYLAALSAFEDLYGKDRDADFYSVAGRSELSGNHTDHNHGCVVAASIDLDIIAVASASRGHTIRVKSEGYAEDVVDFNAYSAPDPAKYGKSVALVAGMATGFRNKGYNICGFDAYTTSSVLKGSGISSSAAFEDMVGNILNYLANDGKVSNVEIAKLAQYAENVFFGKPCGLMDQMACAVGGIIAIDFASPKQPLIEQIGFDMNAHGYHLCLVNTGGNHADLTDDYASVPAEMKAVAAYFGKEVLREVGEAEVIKAIPALRAAVGDRAVLRALHYFEENRRVAAQKAALKAEDLDAFFENVIASGRSSFCYLQNVYTIKNVREQGLSLALCLAERLLAGKRAAWRVHGGGFAGTIQAFVPDDLVETFRNAMDSVFGAGSCLVLRIRPVGAVKL